MNPAEVLGIEVKQYVGQGLKTLVSQVIGQTIEAQTHKAVSSRPSRQWNEASFLQDLEIRQGSHQAAIARQILLWGQERGLSIVWGKGTQWGSFKPIQYHKGQDYHYCITWTSGSLDFYLKRLYRQPPFNQAEKLQEFSQQLALLEGIVPFSFANNPERLDRLNIPLFALEPDGQLQRFLAVLDWIFNQIKMS